MPASAAIQVTSTPRSTRQQAAEASGAEVGDADARDAHCRRAGVVERIVRSGRDLSLDSLQWGERPSPAPALVLTERDLRLMAFLYDVNHLSASQLVALGWGDCGPRAGQSGLKRLHDAGLLDRFRPVRAIGSTEWIYRLSAREWKELAAKQMVEDDTRFTPAALTSIETRMPAKTSCTACQDARST